MNKDVNEISKVSLNPVKTVLFDVDGVLLESASVRDEAFGYVFETLGYPDRQKAIDIHQQHYGVFRKEQFKIIHQELFGSPMPEHLVEELNTRFTDWVFDRVLACSWVEGVKQMMERKRVPYYIVSAAPEEEVIQVIRHQGLHDYFDGVFGGPTPKTQIIPAILDRVDCIPGDAVFIGDRISDFNSAAATGVQFIGRVKHGEPDPFPAGTLVVENLSQLDQLLPA